MSIKSSVVVVAAGKGSRMPGKIKKQFMFLGDKPVVSYSLELFSKSDLVDEIILVTAKEDMEYCKGIVSDCDIHKVFKIIEGGSTRQESVYNGLRSVNKRADVVIVHDAARPFVDLLNLEELIACAYKYRSSTFGVLVKDTIKLKDDNMEVTDTLDRDKLVAVQTPQAFGYGEFLRAHELAKKMGYSGTDDTVLLEKCGITTKVVCGSYFNIKITTKEDLVFADAIKRACLD